MGLKDLIAKFTDEVDDEMYEDEFEEVNEELPQIEESSKSESTSSFRPGKAKTNYGAKQSGNMQMMVIEPKSYDGVEKIADALRELRPVVINFENTDSHDAARIVDFISGTAYALDGKLEKIGKDIFLCVPNNVTINHNDKKNFSELPETMISNWKETNA